MNICRPAVDWDQKDDIDAEEQIESKIENYRKRFREVKRELIVSYIVNWIFSAVMLLPIWYSGGHNLTILHMLILIFSLQNRGET